MRNYISNYNKSILLANRPVKIIEKNTGKEITITFPSVYDTFSHVDFMVLISLLEKDLKELSTMFGGIDLGSHYHAIGLIFALSEAQETLKETRMSLINGLSVFLPNFTIKNSLLIFENEMILTSELFNYIVDIVFDSLDKKQRIIINEEDDPFTKREKEAALRAERIKRSAAKNKAKSEEGDFENMIAAILYEFPQFNLNDIYNMNLYTLNFLFKQIGKIANYEVSVIAAGNGLAKKHKYFIEK